MKYGIRKAENRLKTVIFPFFVVFDLKTAKIGLLDQFSDKTQ